MQYALLLTYWAFPGAAGPKSRKVKGGKSRVTASSGEDTEVGDGADGLLERPRRKPSRRSARLAGSGTDSALTELGETELSANEAEIATQNTRPQPRPAYKPQPRVQPSGDLPPEASSSDTLISLDPNHAGMNGVSPSAVARKRGHSDVEREPADFPAPTGTGESDEEIALPPPDLQIRKRVRH